VTDVAFVHRSTTRRRRRSEATAIWPSPFSAQEPSNMTTSAPVTALIFIGVILTFLGVFAAGSLPLITIGVAAVFGAGIIAVLGQVAGQGKG
jgi:hypothetical protein